MNRTFACTACGRTVREDDGETAYLKDDLPLCRECAAKIRILYPRSFTWQSTYTESSDGFDAGSDERTVWVDPLADMTMEEYREALPAAESVRERMRAELGGGKAYFRVDDNKRRLKNAGKGRIVPSDYTVSGTVILGSFTAEDTIRVHRRGKTLTVKADSAERIIKGLVPKPSEFLDEGCHGILVFKEDVPFIYPGVILEICGQEETV